MSCEKHNECFGDNVLKVFKDSKVFKVFKVVKDIKVVKVPKVIRQKNKKGALAAPNNRSWKTLNTDAVLRPVKPCSQ